MLTYKILGPLEVARDGEVLQLGPAKQRALLACLLLNANATVSKDRLIDALWGEDPPDRADQNLFQHVFRLRKVLDDGGRTVLVRKEPGYLVQLGEEDVLDAARFEELLTASRTATEDDPARALGILDEALALWRGPALADFAFDDFAQTDAARLEEFRVVAEEGRMEALLALGRHNDAIPELRTLVQRHPVREHLYALLALALYRSGRQAEGLNAIQTARQALSAEYGIDVGQELRRLEEAILRQDPELAPPEPKAAPAEVRALLEVPRVEIPTRQERRRHARRSRRVIGITLVLAAAGVAVVAVLLPIEDPVPTGPTVTGSRSTTPTLEELRLDWRQAATGDFAAKCEQRLLGGVDTPAGGFLAYGFSACPGDGGKDYDTAAWTGTGDQQWEQSTSETFQGAGNGRAAAGWTFEDESIVILGWVESEGDFDAAVWKRPTGSDGWEPVRHDDLALGGSDETDDQQIRDAAITTPTTLVAVGFTSTESPGEPDGLDDEPAVWEGTGSGRRWTYMEGAVRPETGDQQMLTVAHNSTSTPHLTVAAGWSEQDGDRDAAVWLYKANHWRRVRKQAGLEGPGEQQINELTAYEGGFVAVGQESSGEDIDAVIWVSPNGKTWMRAGDHDVLGGPDDQTAYSVSSSELGLVAAGREDYIREDGGEESDAAVWTSVDGAHWERLPSEDPTMTALADQGFQEIKGLVPLEDGFLALGAEGPTDDDRDLDASVWIGTLISDS